MRVTLWGVREGLDEIALLLVQPRRTELLAARNISLLITSIELPFVLLLTSQVHSSLEHVVSGRILCLRLHGEILLAELFIGRIAQVLGILRGGLQDAAVSLKGVLHDDEKVQLFLLENLSGMLECISSLRKVLSVKISYW